MREFEATDQDRPGGVRGPAVAMGGTVGGPSLLAQRLAPPDAVLDLQRSGGNDATVQLLSVQRNDHGSDEQEEAGGADGGRSPVLDVIGRGGGQPLDESIKAPMERAIGADLGDVRIHTDGAAASSARAVQAHAYTVGNEVVFGAGQYQPDTPFGQRMLAHELTHVVQQRNGPVDGTATGDGIAVSDPSDRFEQAAESNADRIMSQGAIGGEAAPPAGAGGGVAQREAAGQSEPTAQREENPEEEEEPVQGLWVQREDAPEEEEETS